MHLPRLLLLFLSLWTTSACIYVRSRPPVPFPRPAPPPPVVSPAPMSHDEAVSRGLGYCQQRGYPCQLQEAHLAGRDRWKVKFRVRSQELKGHVHLEYAAYTRELLRSEDKVKPRRGKGRDRDDDEDDDD